MNSKESRPREEVGGSEGGKLRGERIVAEFRHRDVCTAVSTRQLVGIGGW